LLWLNNIYPIYKMPGNYKGASLAFNKANFERRKAKAEANARAKTIKAASNVKHPKGGKTRRSTRRRR
jgi:hypothetical protein